MIYNNRTSSFDMESEVITSFVITFPTPIGLLACLHD
jgi:hypothetical protein